MCYVPIQSDGRPAANSSAGALATVPSPPLEPDSEHLLESVDGAFWSVAPDGSRYFYMSPGVERLTGYSPSEFTNDPHRWERIIHPEDRERVRAILGRPDFDQRQERSLQCRIIRADGQTRWVLFRSRPVFDENGVVVSRSGFTLDISIHKQTEAAFNAITQATSRARSGEEFFILLTHTLCEALGVRYAFTGAVDSRTDPIRVRTIAVCADGLPAENIEYDLAGTPCEDVVGKEPCFIAAGVQARFPGDHRLTEMGVASYLGVPLLSAREEPIGLLVAMHDGPMPNPDIAQSILQIFAARAASEITRLRAEEQLRERERELSFLTEQMPAVFWTTDTELRFTSSSGAGLRDLGLRPGEVVGVSLFDYFRTDDPAYRPLAAHRQALAGESVTYDMDWDDRSFQAHVEPLRDAEGVITGCIGVALDISVRKQAQTKLQESEQLLRTLVDYAPEAVVVLDVDTGRFEEANDNAVRLYGLNRDALCEVGPVETSPPYQPDGRPSDIAARAMIDEALAGGIPVFDWTHRNAQGQDVPCEIRLVRLPTEGRNLLRGSVTDISQRKQAERLADENRLLLEGILESTGDGILVVDNAGKVIHTNTRFAELWRIPEDLIHAGNDDKLLEYVLGQLKDPERFLAKVRELYGSTRADLDTLHFKDGRVFERYSRPLMREGCDPGRVWSFRDITERTRQQAELSRARRLETAGQLAGQIAHDFNNLLGPLAAYPELVRARLEPDSTVHRMLDIMENCASQMADINQQLLTLSRRGHYKIEPLDSNGIIEETLQSTNIPTTISFTEKLEDDLLPFKGGRAQIQRVLVNLLNNAIEAVDGVGEIAVMTDNIYLDRPLTRYATVKQGEYVRIRVADNGSGIPREVMDRIFDPFFTTKSTDKQRGSGLGLSVVHSVMEDHEGYIEIDSTPGNGTTVSLLFPVCREEVTKIAAPASAPRGNGERVLVVDDDPIQRQVAEDALGEVGYVVITACSGEEAVELTSRENFDILILDMVMDGIDGVEALRQIRKRNPEQIAVMLSGFAANDRVDQAMKLGAREFLAKPIRVTTLAAAVRRALTEPAPAVISQ